MLNFLYAGVCWVLLRWHQLFAFVGLAPNSGLNWAMSIVFLVVTARLVLFPLFIKALYYQRQVAQLQPKIATIKATYKDDRAARQRELMKLHQDERVNPLTGCLPILLQVPIFISLFHVLRHLSNSASSCIASASSPKLMLYGFSPAQTCSAASAKLFGGAPLAGSLRDTRSVIETVLRGDITTARIVTIAVVVVSAAATYLTQRMARTSKPAVPEGSAATVQRLLTVGIPLSVLVSGFFFPLGVLLYWFASNIWTLGQQLYVDRLHRHVFRDG